MNKKEIQAAIDWVKDELKELNPRCDIDSQLIPINKTILSALEAQLEDKSLDHCDLMRDEFIRIKHCPNATDEIKQLCDRAISRVDRNIPVLKELELFNALKKQLESGFILFGNEGYSPEFYEIVEKPPISGGDDD